MGGNGLTSDTDMLGIGPSELLECLQKLAGSANSPEVIGLWTSKKMSIPMLHSSRMSSGNNFPPANIGPV